MRIHRTSVLLFALLLTGLITAQTPIRYRIGLGQVAQHELQVSIDFPSVPQQVLEVRMPQASPGRYALHNFAKNVYNVRAFDSQGNELTVYRAAPSRWQVAGHDGTVRFEYTLFGNHADGTYTGIDNRKAHMNMPATFAYGAGMEDRPVELVIDRNSRPDWKVATQLKVMSDSVFWAPDYYYFYDSPTFVGDVAFRRWESSSNGQDYTIELAMLHEGTAEELDDYAEWVKAVVEEEKAVYGELPDFDFGRYTFLCTYNPWVYGDGMEHRNSTICSSRSSLADNARGVIGTVAHEFFHAWNVERIRPQSLEPFNFDEPNMSEALWFAEGFTSYYDDLILCRAGIISPKDYAEGLSGLLNYVLNFPGRQYRSPVEMSYNAPFVDAATANDEDNFANTFISYYSYGAVLGLTLDLTLRTEFDVTLDDFMKRVWEEYGETEVPYRLPDLQRLLGEVTGDPAFAARFFRESVYGSKLPDLAQLLGEMGITMQLKNPEKAGFFGLRLDYTPEGAEVASKVLKTNPLYEAGLTQGSRITKMAGVAPENPEQFQELLQNLEVGQEYDIHFVQNGIDQTARFTAGEDPTLEVMLEGSPSAKAVKRREAWLKH